MAERSPISQPPPASHIVCGGHIRIQFWRSPRALLNRRCTHTPAPLECMNMQTVGPEMLSILIYTGWNSKLSQPLHNTTAAAAPAHAVAAHLPHVTKVNNDRTANVRYNGRTKSRTRVLVLHTIANVTSCIFADKHSEHRQPQENAMIFGQHTHADASKVVNCLVALGTSRHRRCRRNAQAAQASASIELFRDRT